MKFCEKCNYLTEEQACPICGGDKLRDANGEDFCYFADLDSFYCGMFEAALKDNGVEAALVPFYPRGVTHSNAGRTDSKHIYIRYKDFELAREIYDIIFGNAD